MKHFFKEQLFPVIMIIVGAACAAFSIECFLIPNTILDGGVTGVSMMINYLTGIRLSILVIVINIPFFFVGYKALGKRFLLRAVIAMAAFSGFLEVCKLIPTVTSSELLAVVFGGVLLGTGGLLRAYTKSAKDALDAAGIAAVRRWVKLEVGCPYSLFERMKTECLSLDGAVQNVDYGADVLLSLLLPENNAEAFSARVTELSAGACSALAVGEELMPVRIK
mgnify:CR=1 FL=1